MSPGSNQQGEDGQRVTGQVWQFADCEFDERRRELRVRGMVVDVEGKPLDLLHELLVHAGEVVTKDELLDSVWPGVMVVDGSLATAISKLRKAIGSDESIVVTVPRIGYRLGVTARSSSPSLPEWPELHFEPGQVVPERQQWRLLRRLDLSPSSDVWLAEHPKTHERRVFKFAPDAAHLKGLKREVTLARLLRASLGERSDFVRVLEWNFDRPPYFIESEYCGSNLAEWTEAQGGINAVPLGDRLHLVVDIARAVAAAHGIDVLHKDLKPGNILVSTLGDGTSQIKIADFGSASLLAPARLGALGITNLGFTQSGGESGLLTGTVIYMAPEVLAGQSPSATSDVYSLGVLLYQLIVGDFRKPLAPGWEADIADPLLREDIALAACGDPVRRLRTAADLVERLVTLDRRRREATELARAKERASLAERQRAATDARRPWLVLAGVVVLAALAVTVSVYRQSSAAAPPVKILAVLPFENTGSDTNIDFLRLALPDEIATTLSHTRGLAVRPFSTTSKYGEPNLDLEKAARELGVDGIVTGRFVKVGTQLHITLEAVDPDTHRAVWRDTIDAPAQSLLAVQLQIALRVRGGLAPAFGGSAIDAEGRPKSEEAYELFLRSASLAFEAAQNPEGIAKLERAVALDPSYAPAWVALARRYYVEARYGGGTASSMDSYEAAMERAVALDPSYVSAAAGLVVSRVERGDLVGALERAEDLVRRRPNSADAHFALSYVLRFAGLLQESGDHCESALLLDPRSVTSGLRSCAIVFFQRGDYPRANNYVNLQLGSDWTKAFSLDIFVRESKEQEVLQVGAPHIPQWPSYDLLVACVARQPTSQIVALARTVQPTQDPEQNYLAAAHLAYCGQTDRAFEMLKLAITGNYCSSAAVESDRLFATLRTDSRFGEIRSASAACRGAFVSKRNPTH